MKSPSPKKPAHKRNKVCTALGKSLKAHRIAANISQETLAFDAEVDRTYISQIERGVANPSLLTLTGICFALDISLADLFAPVKITSMGNRRANNAKPKIRPTKSRLR